MRLARRKLRLTRGRITKMSQERQRLSFFLVVIFLAVFGLIVLAEVLFVDNDGSRAAALYYGGGPGGGGYDQEEEQGGGGGAWETPRPIDGGETASLASGFRWVLGSEDHQGSSSSSDNGGSGPSQHEHRGPRNERFQLQRSQGGMESLIRNISGGGQSGGGGRLEPQRPRHRPHKTTSGPAVPYNYSDDFLPPSSFDFTLRRHSGHSARWQPVNGTRNKFYVYSAFFDARGGGRRVVRVVGATRTKHPEKVWCRLYYKDEEEGEGEATTTQAEEKEEDEEGAVYEEGSTVTVRAARVLGTVAVIRENWNLRYSAVFVICPLPAPSSPKDGATEDGEEAGVPHSVSVVAGGAEEDEAGPHVEPTNQLKILNRHVPDAAAASALNASLSSSDDVGVCVKPLHFHYARTLELLEFLELNKLLGARRFTLYNHTVSKEVSCVLADYAERGEVELLPWRLNVASQTEIRTEGLFAALNDCLYRNMWRFNYLLLADLDEFVIPRHNRTLADMLRFLDEAAGKKGGPLRSVMGRSRGALRSFRGRGGGGGGPENGGVTSSYSFQNAFFYLQFPDDEEAPAAAAAATKTAATAAAASPSSPPRMRLPLRTLTKTRRKAKFNPQKQRSKYICIPRRVREAGNHFIWEFSEGFNLNVPVSVGFLHHYRVCEFGGDDCVRTESKVDRTAFRYRDDLLKNVGSVLERLRDKCNLGHIIERTRGGGANSEAGKKTSSASTPKS